MGEGGARVSYAHMFLMLSVRVEFKTSIFEDGGVLCNKKLTFMHT